MKPTMIKTQTTKSIIKLADDEIGQLDIGGVTFHVRSDKHSPSRYWFEREGRGSGLVEGGVVCEDCCSKNITVDKGNISTGGFHPNHAPQVTVTDTREMTTDDLQVGDCFRIDGQVSELAFMVWLGDYRVINMRHDCQPKVQQVGEVAGLEVQRVSPFLEATAKRSGDQIRCDELCPDDSFELGGHEGRVTARILGAVGVPNYIEAEWDCGWPAPKRNFVRLAGNVRVTDLRKARFDSWDDVSVGDVAIDAMGGAAIFLGGFQWLDCQGQPYAAETDASKFTPARLTSIDWDRITEVTR